MKTVLKMTPKRIVMARIFEQCKNDDMALWALIDAAHEHCDDDYWLDQLEIVKLVDARKAELK